MALAIWVQSQFESYQTLKKWHLMTLCLTLSIIRYGSRVKWHNPGKEVVPSPTPWWSKLSKRDPSDNPRLWSPTSLLLLYILWDDWPIFMISGSNEQLQQESEYTLLQPYCHSWWISKMQSGRDDTLQERYAIKLSFKLEKNATETYGRRQTSFRPSCMNGASVFE